MDKDEELEKIENYLLGTLSKAENQQVEEQIAKDKTFAKAVDVQKDMSFFLADTKAFDLSLQLEQLGETYTKKSEVSTKPKSKKLVYWSMAVAASLLIFVLGWTYFASATNTEQLFATNYETYIPNELERSDNDNNLTFLAKGIEHYSNKDYSLAIKQLSLALNQENTPQNSHETILFYIAMSYLENNNYALAKERLEQISGGAIGIYTQQTYWYLALIELKNGEVTTCKQRLKEVLKLSDKGKYATQAKELLNKL